MLMEVKKNLILLKEYFKLNLSASMEYRTSFLVQTFGMVLNNASFAFFWWLLFEQVQSIEGYGFTDVMILWAIASTSFGITFVLFGNLRRLTEIIIKGELDSYLLQPKDVVINVLASRTIISAWGDILYGIVLFLIVTKFNLIGFLLFCLFCITGSLIFGGVLLLVNSLTFFYGNAEGVSQMVLEFIITLTIYPESIYKGVVRLIIYTVIPSAFITLMPLRIIRSFNLINTLSIIGVSILWVCFAYIIFYKGLRKYESGNLIVQKM